MMQSIHVTHVCTGHPPKRDPFYQQTTTRRVCNTHSTHYHESPTSTVQAVQAGSIQCIYYTQVNRVSRYQNSTHRPLNTFFTVSKRLFLASSRLFLASSEMEAIRPRVERQIRHLARSAWCEGVPASTPDLLRGCNLKLHTNAPGAAPSHPD